MSEKLNVHGIIEIRLFDPSGDLKDYRLIPNLITEKGFNKYLQAVFNNETVSKGTFIAIGSTATSLASSDTDLEAEIDVVRGVGTYGHTEDTAQGTVAYTFGTGGPWSIVEMALFDASSSGTMICRGTFAAVNKGTADTFEAKYIHSLS